MLTMILQHSICKRYTLSTNHSRRILSEMGLPCLGGSALLVTCVLPNRTEVDCVAKGWIRTAQELMGDSSAFRDLHDL